MIRHYYNNSFLLAVKVLGYEKDIPAGNFRLEKASNNFQIIDQLVNGIQVSKRVTIREGWTISMVAKELEKTLGIEPKFFEEASQNKILLKSGKYLENLLKDIYSLTHISLQKMNCHLILLIEW